MPADSHFDGDDAVLRQFVELRPLAPVDQPRRQMKQEIDDARLGVGRSGGAQQLRQHLVELGPDALETAGAGEKRIEDAAGAWRPISQCQQHRASRCADDRASS